MLMMVLWCDGQYEKYLLDSIVVVSVCLSVLVLCNLSFFYLISLTILIYLSLEKVSPHPTYLSLIIKTL